MEPAKRWSDMLLVEDNRADATLLQMALLQHCALPYLIHVVNEGEAALKFLHQVTPYAQAPRPDLIILDIGLPKKDGWEVLAAIRAMPALRTIPVVMLTGILSPVDEERRDQLQPTWCLVKPPYLAHYLQLVRMLETVLNAAEHPTPQSQPEQTVLKRGTLPYITLKEGAEAVVTEAQELIAHSDDTLTRTRQVLQRAEGTFHHHRARREREAEQQPSSSALPRAPSADTNPQPAPQPAPEPAPKHESE